MDGGETREMLLPPPTRPAGFAPMATSRKKPCLNCSSLRASASRDLSLWVRLSRKILRLAPLSKGWVMERLARDPPRVISPLLRSMLSRLAREAVQFAPLLASPCKPAELFTSKSDGLSFPFHSASPRNLAKGIGPRRKRS